MTESELHRAIGEFVDRELLCCDSSLVEDIRALETPLEGFSYDEIENAYTEFEEGEEGTCSECDEEEIPLDEDMNVCEDCFESEPKEIYEWWRVTKWFAGKLRAAGEPVLDNNYGTWWGRCTTGQAVLLDYVIRKIYKEVNKL